MTPEDAEIKVTVVADEVTAAVDAFALPDDRPPWRIHFWEDVTPGTNADTPLLDAGVVLRSRVKERADGDTEADTTVKLRPARRSQLFGEVTGPGAAKVKIEADWSGENRALAVSMTEDLTAGQISALSDPEPAAGHIFGKDQKEFLRECANVRVNLAPLTLLPAVRSYRWKPFPVEVGETSLSVRAERWSVEHLDFLELSVLAPLADAPQQQRLLERAVQERGLSADPTAESKTRTVLQVLVSRLSA